MYYSKMETQVEPDIGFTFRLGLLNSPSHESQSDLIIPLKIEVIFALIPVVNIADLCYDVCCGHYSTLLH